MGKLSVSAVKQEIIERSVDLGVLKREFLSVELKEEEVFNYDKTYFVIDQHNYKTLERRRAEKVKYADAVSGHEGLTMMDLLSEGPQAAIGTPFLIFKKEACYYPIRGVPGSVTGVCYRSGPRAWVDGPVFFELITENWAFPPLPNGRRRVLYLDNCSGNMISETVGEELRKINTVVRFFPPNSTDLVEPADYFVIQKIKTGWRARWDAKRMDNIENRCWENGRKGAGKKTNPGKKYFLQLAADVIKDVSMQRGKDGTLYSRKAMIRCSMGFNLNGQWEVRQLFSKLQEIIRKYPENFNGTPVTPTDDIDCEATDTDDDIEG